MKAFYIISIAILLSACAVQNPYGDGADIGRVADLPPVSVFYIDLSERLEEECNAYRNESVIHYCYKNVFDVDEVSKALTASGRFAQVSVGDRSNDYQLMISSATLARDDAKGMANAVVSGATLMLYPMKQEQTLKVEFFVTWRGQLIDRIYQEIPVEFALALWKSPEASKQVVAKALADKLLESIDSKQSMSANRLFEVLEASDYEVDLEVAEQVGEFRLRDQGLFHDPFAGTVLSFTHQQFLFDRIDVFVYPVRATRWDNRKAILGGEMDNVRKEIHYYEDEGHISDIILNDAEVRRWGTAAKPVSVGFMDGSYHDANSDKFYTSVHTFIKKDKFVKVRASFPVSQGDASVSAPHDFVRALMQSIKVPDESPFMARVRNMSREGE